MNKTRVRDIARSQPAAAAARESTNRVSIAPPAYGVDHVDSHPVAQAKHASWSQESPHDVISTAGAPPGGIYLDQPGPAPPAPVPAAPAPGPAPAPAPAAPAAPAPAPAAAVGPARPTNLLQLLTAWTPGPNRYGFQLKFRCRSTSGDVRDLQNQAPNLILRERVTYSRNDFSHRINPPNPTILPPGGISFAAANTRRVGANLIEFNGVTDTHWMPTSAVRINDFRAAGPGPGPGFIGPVRPPLPARMVSRQVYQYSPDAGATWRYLAGAFIIRRTLARVGGAARFTTQKTGVHTVSEPYKP